MIIVSYDIHDDKVRTKFSKFLKQYGRMLQYSVYELKNSNRVKKIILLEIEKMFGDSFDNGDSIIIFNVCEGCNRNIIRYGYPVSEEEELVFI